VEFEFILPSRIIFGCNKRLLLAEKAAGFGAKMVIIVTSRGMVNREKVLDILEAIKKEGLTFQLYPQIPPEPHLADAEACLGFSRKHKAGLVIGIGGGSVLDVAKKVAMDSFLPMIMLPTTSGTGSEVTHESVLKVDGKKKAFVSGKLVPDIAIVDPELSMSMPPRLTSSTGIDALAHAIECYESRRSNAMVKAIASKALELLKENIGQAAEGDREARINMSLGSMLAGIAFGNSGTTLAHALSYPLSNRGVPHGEALAMVFPGALEFNLTDPALADELSKMADRLELKWEADWNIQEMAEEVMADKRHLANNPRQATYDDILRIFSKVKNTLS